MGLVLCVAQTQRTVGGRKKGHLFPTNSFWIWKFSSVFDIFSLALIYNKRTVLGAGSAKALLTEPVTIASG